MIPQHSFIFRQVLSACALPLWTTAAGTGGGGAKGGQGGWARHVSGNGGTGGSGGFGGFAGAIRNSGMLIITNCSFASNLAGPAGSGGDGGVSGPVGSFCCTGSGGSGADGGSGGNGGAIWNDAGTVIFTKCDVMNNSAGRAGAAGSVGGLGSTITNGLAGDGGNGGGVGNSGTLSLIECTLSGNSSGQGGTGASGFPPYVAFPGSGGIGGSGGGVFNSGNVTFLTITFRANSGGIGGITGSQVYAQQGSGGSGGAFFNCGTGNVSTCTFSENSGGSGYISGNGGAAFSSHALTMVSCTIASNRAFRGGGLFYINNNTTVFSVRNSVIAFNSATSGSDLFGPFTSNGHNLVGDGCCGFTNNGSSDLVGTTNATIDPQLGPLAGNGGLTPTHALLPGSPAIDAGDDSLAGTDQRGRPRLSGAHVDIGAFEFQAPTPQPLTSLRNTTNGGFQFTITNVSDVTPNVLVTTNIAAPTNQWLNLGPATFVTNGMYQFSDPLGVTQRQRFFRLLWP